MPVSVFFEGLENRQQAGEGGEMPAAAGGEEQENTLQSREALMLARYFQSIRDPQIRAAIRELAERCAEQQADGASSGAAPAPKRGRGRRAEQGGHA